MADPTHEFALRDAQEVDLPEVVGLFNALLSTTTIEYTEVPHTVEGRRAWLRERVARGFPVIVAESVRGPERAGAVVGVASYGDFRDSLAREGYRGTVEHTVHVDRAWWGSGVGRALVEELLRRAAVQGAHVMIGAIDAEHEDSLRFHERLGFRETARLTEVGRKFDRWLDLVLVQRYVDQAGSGSAGEPAGSPPA